MWWHGDAYELMGITPTVDATLSAYVDGLERRAARRVPGAVREWFSIRGAADWLALRRSNPMVTCQELGRPLDGIDYLARGELATETDSQYCCRWVVRLPALPSGALSRAREADDPVVELVDPEGEDQLVERYADCFSDYVFASVWDAELRDDVAVSEFDHPLPTGALAELRARYPELPTTYSWAGNQGCDAMYRFDGDVQVLLAVAGGIAVYSVVAADSATQRAEVQALIGAK